MKLALCFPWDSPFMYSQAVDSLLRLEIPANYEHRWFRGLGWCCSRRHIHMCAEATEWGADLICLLGPDQVFPSDLLPRLLDTLSKLDADGVAAQVPTRGYIEQNGLPPFGLQGWVVKDGHTTPVTETGPIDFIGSGCLLFKASLLKSLPHPWFQEQLADPRQYTRYGNVDSRFVQRLKAEAGAKLIVDTTIPIQHLHIFKIDDTFSRRFADWAEPGVGDPELCRFKE